jgi:uncharacterized membrane protein HdeD (DUF308 family)
MIVTNPLNPGAWTREQMRRVSSGWPILLLTGIISVIAGAIILSIDWTVSDLAVFLGALLVFRGIFMMFSGIMTIAGSVSGRDVIPYWGWMLAFGILETLFSFWLLARPGLTLVAVVLAIGLWSVIYGVFQIALSFEVKSLPARADKIAQSVEAMSPNRTLDTAASR